MLERLETSQRNVTSGIGVWYWVNCMINTEQLLLRR